MNHKKESVLRLIASIFLCLLMSTSCSETETPPEHIIPVDDMVQIVADIELTESYMLSIRRKVERDSLGRMRYNLLLEKHNISREKYQESMDFYLEHQVLLREIYTRALEELNKREVELKAQEE